MGKKGPLWWRESDWLLRGSSAANQILLRHSGPILSIMNYYRGLEVTKSATGIRGFQFIVQLLFSQLCSCGGCGIIDLLTVCCVETCQDGIPVKLFTLRF